MYCDNLNSNIYWVNDDGLGTKTETAKDEPASSLVLVTIILRLNTRGRCPAFVSSCPPGPAVTPLCSLSLRVDGANSHRLGVQRLSGGRRDAADCTAATVTASTHCWFAGSEGVNAVLVSTEDREREMV